MATTEIYAKCVLAPGALAAFTVRIENLAAQAKLTGKDHGLLRYDWFVHDGRSEAVLMADVATDVAAQLVADGLASLKSSADIRVLLLGKANIDAGIFAPFSPGQFAFAGGLNPDAPTPGKANDGQAIEIFTWFEITPGMEVRFQQLADEMLAIVAAKDPGTSRYDWFYDTRRRFSIAMDTYADTPGMFAHMKNCHDPHDELLTCGKMTTEFLGALPDDAYQAIAKYDPFILNWRAGLNR